MRKTLRQPLLSTVLLTLAGTALRALAQESPNSVSPGRDLHLRQHRGRGHLAQGLCSLAARCVGVRYFTGRNPLIEGRLAGRAALVWRGQRHQQHDAQELLQNLSVEAGDESNITRSETSIQSDIMNNLSMKFAIKVKNQSEVPIGREKTDTEASVTTLLRL
jgi:hypothetical protein